MYYESCNKEKYGKKNYRYYDDFLTNRHSEIVFIRLHELGTTGSNLGNVLGFFALLLDTFA